MGETRETRERCKKDGDSKGGRADSSRGEIGVEGGGRKRPEREGEEEERERSKR